MSMAYFVQSRTKARAGCTRHGRRAQVVQLLNGERLAMDAATAEDVIFLAMTFLIAIALTTAILVWGRVTWGKQGS
jgi:hypothetical protein